MHNVYINSGRVLKGNSEAWCSEIRTKRWLSAFRHAPTAGLIWGMVEEREPWDHYSDEPIQNLRTLQYYNADTFNAASSPHRCEPAALVARIVALKEALKSERKDRNNLRAVPATRDPANASTRGRSSGSDRPDVVRGQLACPAIQIRPPQPSTRSGRGSLVPLVHSYQISTS